jgi:hypothetical protein
MKLLAMDIIASLSKAELELEGITSQLLAKAATVRIDTPVQLQPGDEPVSLLKCNTGYWVKVPGGFLKNANGQMYVVTPKEAQIGYIRYALNFRDEFRQKTVAKELHKLKQEVDLYIQAQVVKMKDIMKYAGMIEPGLAINIEAKMDPETFNRKRAAAKEICTEDFREIFEYLEVQLDLEDEKEYDSLYCTFFNEGLPVLARFNTNSKRDVEVLKQFFSSKHVLKTLMSYAGKGHLEMVATFNADKILSKTAFYSELALAEV